MPGAPESLLTPEQEARAVEVMRECLAAPAGPDGRTPFQVSTDRDKERHRLIAADLRPLVESYLAGQTTLEAFKSRIDGINKREEHWGFKGIKGQMFFNMVVNSAHDPSECDQELKAAITVPANEDMAKSRIRTFASYVRRIGDAAVEAGASKQSRPKPGSIPFFLSYFWQIQDPAIWPVYYTNSVNTMADLNLWQPVDDIAEDYIAFKRIHERLARVYSQAVGRPFDLYGVEHVFWFKGGNPYDAAKPFPKAEVSAAESTPAATVAAKVAVATAPAALLPDSYVPPIIGILPTLAFNAPGMEEMAKNSGTSVPRAFEKAIHAAFTILGYDTKLLGQGAGRVPDGLAVEPDSSYALMWDAKVRTDAYSMGTDDRVIREYINTQSRELKRRRSLRNIYYVVISSRFSDDFDDAVRSIKMDTDISEVILLEASALVAMVEAKLRDPLQITLGPDGLQRLFSSSGIITLEDIEQNVTG